AMLTGSNEVGWRFLQESVENLVSARNQIFPQFVNSADFPGGFDGIPRVTNSLIPLIEPFTIDTLRAAAGLHEDGFTRKFPRTIAAVEAPGSVGQRAYMGSQNSDDTRI